MRKDLKPSITRRTRNAELPAKKEGIVLIDRATYKQLKHYSKAELERFLTEYYLNAAEDALDVFIGKLKNEKGIGPRTIEKIEKIRSCYRSIRGQDLSGDAGKGLEKGASRHDRAQPD